MLNEKGVPQPNGQFELWRQSSPLLRDTKEQLTTATFPNSEMPMYGGLPFFKQRADFAKDVPEQVKYFEKLAGKPLAKEAPDQALLYALKAGEPLSALAERILAHYPKQGDEPGQVVSVFGLSGSGKSTALRSLQHVLGDAAIPMDSDTVRYHLMAKIVLDAEEREPDEVQQSAVIHNKISGPLYMLLDAITPELRRRGYTVIRSSTRPYFGADHTFYIEHPEGIDPQAVAHADLANVAHTLWERTQRRVDNLPDDYNWEHAKQETEFRSMNPITVQVPESAHVRFLNTLATDLTKLGPNLGRIKNPAVHEADPVVQEQNIALSFEEQFRAQLS